MRLTIKLSMSLWWTTSLIYIWKTILGRMIHVM